MIFGYARVSTKTQARDGNSLEAQREALITAGAEKSTRTRSPAPRWTDRNGTGCGRSCGAAMC